MRQLTFETFLKQYLADISGQPYLNIHKLVQLSEDNIRIIDPLILYSLFTNKVNILSKYLDAKQHPLLKELNINNYLDEKFHNYSFTKIHDSYLNRINASKYDNDIKSMIRQNILKMMKEKHITTYRIFTDLKANPGNINDFIKNNNTNKVSLKLVESIYDYCLTR